MSGLPNRLREALARRWTPFWRRRGPIAVKTEHGGESYGRADARARFWAEFREGQREAEARRSGPR